MTRAWICFLALGLALAVLALLLLAARFDLALCLVQHPQVMLGVLLEVLRRNPVIAQLGIACQLVVLVNDLLRGSAHFAFGARAVEHTVDDIAAGGTVAVILRPRT